MKRILVTGNAGSGKSTTARRIAAELNLSCHGLDGIVWRPGWRKTPPEERDREIHRLIRRESWVIDGVSPLVQEAAEVVIFLDVKRRVSFWRVCRRNWRYLFRSRPGLPPDCPEIRIVPTLCRIIWSFPVKIRPRILEQGRKCPLFFHVENPTDLEECVAELAGREARIRDRHADRE